MNTETLALFKTLTEMQAAPGFEREILHLFAAN